MTPCILSEMYQLLRGNSCSSTLKKKAACSSETFVYMYQTTRCHALKDRIIYNNLHKQLKSLKMYSLHSYRLTSPTNIRLASWSLNWSMVFYANPNLTLILLTWRIWWAPNNASRWQIGFNSALKVLNKTNVTSYPFKIITYRVCLSYEVSLDAVCCPRTVEI
jgi:hypothetical protein